MPSAAAEAAVVITQLPEFSSHGNIVKQFPPGAWFWKPRWLRGWPALPSSAHTSCRENTLIVGNHAWHSPGHILATQGTLKVNFLRVDKDACAQRGAKEAIIWTLWKPLRKFCPKAPSSSSPPGQKPLQRTFCRTAGPGSPPAPVDGRCGPISGCTNEVMRFTLARGQALL